MLRYSGGGARWAHPLGTAAFPAGVHHRLGAGARGYGACGRAVDAVPGALGLWAVPACGWTCAPGEGRGHHPKWYPRTAMGERKPASDVALRVTW